MNTGHRITRLGAILIAAGSMIGFVPSAASAEGGSAVWGVDTTSRVFETYAEIPHRFYPGFPTTEVSLSSPGQCETFGAGYFAGIEIEEAVLGTMPGYKNPTLARARNPETGGYPSKAQVAPVGGQGGPAYTAECASPDTGHGTARTAGFTGPGGSAGSGLSETTETLDRQAGAITSETTTALTDLRLGGSLRIDQITSYMKTVFTPDAEPKVTYRITLQGISTGADGVSTTAADGFAVGDGGLTLAGKDVGGSDLIKQFNEQSKTHENDLSALARYGFRILAPRFSAGDEGYTVEAPVMDAGLYFSARQNQTGQGQALRIGMARFSGSYHAV